jgi:hypothetical protein
VLRLAADENFNNDIVRGLLRRKPDLDIVRVQDAGLSGADDPEALEWAASEGRVLVTHDVSTLSKHAYDRIEAGRAMPGVFEISDTMAVGRAIDDLLLLVECSVGNEWEGQVRYLRAGGSSSTPRTFVISNPHTSRRNAERHARALKRHLQQWRPCRAQRLCHEQMFLNAQTRVSDCRMLRCVRDRESPHRARARTRGIYC